MSDSTAPVWRAAFNVCTLADAERHLGHAVRSLYGWTAYNGTRLNAAADGFKELGTFTNIAEAKLAIEDSLGICQRPAHDELVWRPLSVRETPRNEIQDNVSKMPIYKIDDQMRYRD
jgi:hypothetical protein